MDVLSEVTESYEKYLCDKADLMKFPLAATFELSPLCNLDCEMCYIHQKVGEVKEQGGLLNKEFWIEKARESMKCGTLFLLITGGEPFLYPNFKELYLQLHRLGVFIAINTNATLINEETIEWLKKFPPRRLNISLYGSSNETYARLCKDPNGFSKAKRAIELLQENGISIRISHVRTPENYKDYQGIIDFCNMHKLYLSVSYYMFPSIRKYCGVHKKSHRLSPQESAQCAFEYSRDQRTTEDFDHYLFMAYHNDYQSSPIYGHREITCRAGNSTFWINWKGEMLPCGMMTSPSFSVRTLSVEEGWAFIRQETEKIKMSAKCSVCEKRSYCMICGAAAQSETGRFDGTPEYLCELTTNYVKKLRTEFERRKK